MSYKPNMTNLCKKRVVEHTFGSLINGGSQARSATASSSEPRINNIVPTLPLSRNDLIDNPPTVIIPAERSVTIPEQKFPPVPGDLVLDYSQPGFFLGGDEQVRKKTYVGIPQDMDGHVLIVGNTGSGKTTGLVIPTLQTWTGTLVATDVKGDLVEAYKRLRKDKIATRSCIIFDLSDPETLSYDPWMPLSRLSEDDVPRYILDMAQVLIPETPNDREPFWRDSARALLAAVLQDSYERGLSFPQALSRFEVQTTSELCEELSFGASPDVKGALGEINNLDQKQRASFDREIRNLIHPIASNRSLMHALRGEREGARCFDWNVLDNSNCILRIPEDYIDAVGSVINLLYTQLFRYLQRRPEKYSLEGKNTVPVLLLLDEFAQCGNLPFLHRSLSTLRSRNVKFCLSIQSFAQLEDVYGPVKRRIIEDNCTFHVVLGTCDVQTQKNVADRIGTRLKESPGQSFNTDAFCNVTGFSFQLNTQREYSIQPHELGHLDGVLVHSPRGAMWLAKHKPGQPLLIDPHQSALLFPNCESLPPIDNLNNPGVKILTAEERYKGIKNCLVDREKDRLALQNDGSDTTDAHWQEAGSETNCLVQKVLSNPKALQLLQNALERKRNDVGKLNPPPKGHRRLNGATYLTTTRRVSSITK